MATGMCYKMYRGTFSNANTSFVLWQSAKGFWEQEKNWNVWYLAKTEAGKTTWMSEQYSEQERPWKGWCLRVMANRAKWSCFITCFWKYHRPELYSSMVHFALASTASRCELWEVKLKPDRCSSGFSSKLVSWKLLSFKFTLYLSRH